MHRNADNNDNDRHEDTNIQLKIGKFHSIVRNLRQYFEEDRKADKHRKADQRRKPFKFEKEEESPPPTAIEGNIICFIDRDASLFNKSKYPDLSNYVVEFFEIFTTGALFPTIRICPSIEKLGDMCYNKDDPKVFCEGAEDHPFGWVEQVRNRASHHSLLRDVF